MRSERSVKLLKGRQLQNSNNFNKFTAAVCLWANNAQPAACLCTVAISALQYNYKLQQVQIAQPKCSAHLCHALVGAFAVSACSWSCSCCRLLVQPATAAAAASPMLHAHAAACY
eukprot:14306-Heterococcus_DN1.PRE.2